jgi:ParB-like chromosome segregation protein Spo0J
VDWRSLGEIEAEAIAIAYRLSDFNQSATARRLGISRPTLARKLELHDIRRPPKQPRPAQAQAKRGTIRATIEEMLAVSGRWSSWRGSRDLCLSCLSGK